MDAMNDFEQSVHRTWVEGLMLGDYKEAVELILDAELCVTSANFDPDSVIISLPANTANKLPKESPHWDLLERTLKGVLQDHLTTQNGEPINLDSFPIIFRVKLLKPEEGWKENVRERLRSKQLSSGT